VNDSAKSISTISSLPLLPSSLTSSLSTSNSIATNIRSPSDPTDPPVHLNVLLVEDNLVNQKVAKRLVEREGHTVTVLSNGQEAVSKFHESPDAYDVILMDLHMPIMDGLTATVLIRQAEAVFTHQNLSRYASTPRTVIAGTSSNHLTSTVMVDSPQEDNPLSRATTSSSQSFLPNNSQMSPNFSSFRLPIIAVTASAMQDERERCMQSGMDDIILKPIDMRILSSKMSVIANAKKERLTHALSSSTNAIEEVQDSPTES
jgi:CheY-like chemotaxis protein